MIHKQRVDHRMFIAFCFLLLWGPHFGLRADEEARIRGIQVHDWGLESGFQNYWGNQYRRGRTLVVNDFDGDGWTDFFVGNVRDESFVYRNLGVGRDGVVRFGVAQGLLQDDLAFAASAADYDNDSDLDLFVGCGGRDGSCLDHLFRNDSTTGAIRFTDVSFEAGIAGPAPDGVPLALHTGGATWGDYDRDGDQDLFVSMIDGAPYNVLWRNNGDGTFSDVTERAQLRDWDPSPGGDTMPLSFGWYQGSSWIDVDNDGDLDLFLNDSFGSNVLFLNHLVEEGVARFSNVTHIFSLPGEDLRYPIRSFASAVADLNNDGWQDLIVFTWSSEEHGLYINDHGLGFHNVTSLGTGVNEADAMAMGCQVTDLNADGIPDLVIGDGMPATGVSNELWLSQGLSNEIPVYSNASHFIEFEPPHGIDPSRHPYPTIPPFPYRTHGIAGADFDGDGRLELAVVNGGAARSPDHVREPNRLFHFKGHGFGKTIRVRLKGDGVHDSRDAIGARAYVDVDSRHGVRRVFRTVLGGSGFSAQNELTLTFGIGDGSASRLVVLWPSGCVQVHPLLQATVGVHVVDEKCDHRLEGPDAAQAWLESRLLDHRGP